MRFLFLGDIVGRPGRDAINKHLPDLRRELGLDAVVANGENAAAGFGITQKICKEMFEAGVDLISGGNHSWDQREALSFIDDEPRLLRPQNYPAGTPGRGSGVVDAGRGRKLLVVNLMARLYMDPLDDPFATMKAVLSSVRLGATANAILLDFHGEATSEKMAMGHFVDGKVSLCVGTHTHVPTADTMILPGGTAYQTDAGMCGDYDSVIGMDKEAPLARFTRKLPTEKVRKGGRLQATQPQLV
ncbi:MAG: TIGR00282 family metallophosphoesterase [Limibacillus sp.]